MVFLPDYCIDCLDYSSSLLRLYAPKTIPLVPSNHLELTSLDLLGEVVEVQLELVLHLLPWQVPIRHQQSISRL